MGRKKIELKTIECPKERNSKYSKRKKGILKKAYELAMLCNIDIVMIIVSPTNKPTLFHTSSRPVNQILDKFCKISLQEQEERRAYSVKTVKNLVNMNNDDVSVENDHILCERDEVIQDDNKVTKLKEINELIDEKELILRDWKNPDEVNDLNRLNIMENYIVSSLCQIKNILNKMKIQEDNQNRI